MPRYTHEQRLAKKIKLCEVAAKIAVCEGVTSWSQLNDDLIRKHWDTSFEEHIPSVEQLIRKVNHANVRWYIRNHLEFNSEIWNADFLQGLATGGVLRFHSKRYPSLGFTGVPALIETLALSPFSGKIVEVPHDGYTYWRNVPALMLQHSEDSLSFMAGVLGAGKIVTEGDTTYVQYRTKAKEYLDKWGIPIDIRKSGRVFLVSPFWAALFSIKMPKELRVSWLELKNPAKTDSYAPVIWAFYSGTSQWESGRIPYLKSSTWFYSQIDSIKDVGWLRVKFGLAQLNNKIAEIMRLWIDLPEDIKTERAQAKIEKAEKKRRKEARAAIRRRNRRSKARKANKNKSE